MTSVSIIPTRGIVVRLEAAYFWLCHKKRECPYQEPPKGEEIDKSIIRTLNGYSF